MKTTDQVKKVPNPTGKGGFADNPEHRNPGGWKKSDTPRAKLEKMMQLSTDELKRVAEDKDAPLFEKKLAIALKDGDWRVIKEMIQEVYGKPKESVDVTTGGEPMTALVRIIKADAPSND